MKEQNGSMTNTERSALAKLVQRRERLAKGEVAARSAELRADFEKQLATEYDPWDEAWSDAYTRAAKEIHALNMRIAQEFEQAGLPPKTAPRATMGWSARGENVSAARRTELRVVATSRIAASEKAAKVEIERQSVEVQTQLLVGGLASEEARAFLASMPTAEVLMPRLSVAELDSGSAAP